MKVIRYLAHGRSKCGKLRFAYRIVWGARSGVLFGVPPNRSFRRVAPAVAGRGRVRSPILRVCEKRERCGILVSRGSAQGDGNSQGFKKSLKIEIMLLGQDLRGGHQSRRPTCFSGQEHGCKGHKRLAGPDIALQKAIIRRGAARSRRISAMTSVCDGVKEYGSVCRRLSKRRPLTAFAAPR